MNRLPQAARPETVLPDGAKAPAGRRTLRSYWAIDEREDLIGFAQTVLGKIVLLTLFAAVLASVKYSAWWSALLITVAAAACAYLPEYRARLLFAATLLALFGRPDLWIRLDGIEAVMRQEGIEGLSVNGLAYAALLLYFAGAGGLLEWVRRRPALLIARRPVLTLLALQALLCVLASSPVIYGTARVALWTFLTVFTAYLWFFAYALTDQRARERSPHLFQLGTFHPFWGSSTIPYGKGAAFLRKMQAKTPEDLAITQIKALKLLLWSVVLLLLQKSLIFLCETRFSLPTPEAAEAAYFRAQPYPVVTGWLSLIWATAKEALSLAISGHQIIAVARLAGFRLPRNTWRPLEARTLAELWNRYYYYFKELLVEFFFLPTFFRVLRNHPRWRVFFATFMAAGVGNAVVHFIRDVKLVATMGWWWTVETYTSYLFYCFVLACGIGISQARASAGFKPATGFWGSLCSVLCVWAFFVCLYVFGDETRTYTLGERLSFMFHLFGGH